MSQENKVLDMEMNNGREINWQILYGNLRLPHVTQLDWNVHEISSPGGSNP